MTTSVAPLTLYSNLPLLRSVTCFSFLELLKQHTYFPHVMHYNLSPLGPCVTGTGIVTPSGKVIPVGLMTSGGTGEGGVLWNSVVGRTNVTSRHNAANSTAREKTKVIV